MTNEETVDRMLREFCGRPRWSPEGQTPQMTCESQYGGDCKKSLSCYEAHEFGKVIRAQTFREACGLLCLHCAAEKRVIHDITEAGDHWVHHVWDAGANHEVKKVCGAAALHRRMAEGGEGR